MPIFNGSTEILSIKAGTSDVSAVYQGATQVWPTAAPPPVVETADYIGTSTKQNYASGYVFNYITKTQGAAGMPPFGGAYALQPGGDGYINYVTGGDGDYSGYMNQGWFETYVTPGNIFQGPCQPFSYVPSDLVTINGPNTFGGGTWNSAESGYVGYRLTISAINALRLPFIYMNLPHYEDIKDDLPQWMKDMIVDIINTGEELPGVDPLIAAQVRPALFLENVGTPELPSYLATKGELAGQTFSLPQVQAMMT